MVTDYLTVIWTKLQGKAIILKMQICLMYLNISGTTGTLSLSRSPGLD